MKILNQLKITFLSKAYTEGVYSDTPANRKLGRVGMSYIEYNKKLKDDKESKSEKKYYYVEIPDSDSFMLEEGATSKERAIELAVDYAEDMIKYNDYKEFHFNLKENTENWKDEDINNEDKIPDWLSITAEKYGNNIEISIYDFSENKFIRNDSKDREMKNFTQRQKALQKKQDKEFERRFGWMEEVIEYKKQNKDE